MAMFDATENRLSYSELLQPEVGYKLDFAVGLTYSLNLDALLGVLVSLGLLDDGDSELMQSPFYLLEAIRKSSDSLAVFCNGGSISLPQKIQSVYSLLENSVFEVKLPNRQNFHPKLWCLKYTNEQDHSYIRLLILSRNLTFDNSIDVCAAMKGELTRRKHDKNRPLADLLTYVSVLGSKSKQHQILQLAEDVLHVKEFGVELPFADYEFLPLGFDGYDKNNIELFDSKHDIFVVSPFLSESVIADLAQCSNNKVLVTRKASVTPKVIDTFDSVYVTKDVLNDNEYGVKHEIHAKLYFTTTKRGNFLYLGSANASHNAFHRNVEFLLKLKYKPNYVGFKTFFKDFIPEEDCPYEEIKAAPEKTPPSPEDLAIEEALKEAVYALQSARVKAENNTYSVQVKSRPLETKRKVKLAPLQRQDLLQSVTPRMVFSGLLLKELSEFYVLMVEEERIVVKIETRGIPKERDNAIYKSIIDTNNKFLAYVSFMLADDYVVAALEETDYKRMMGRDIESNAAPAFTAVYERMLRVVHRNPARLREVADLIKRLDQNIVGEGFLEMYKQFELAAKKVAR